MPDFVPIFLVSLVGQKWCTFLGRGSGGVGSAGVSQSVRETGRDEAQSVPSPEKALQNKGFGAPNF